MKRWIALIALCLAAAAPFASPALAHFVFVVPEPGGGRAKVVMSEGLAPDPDVDVAGIAALKLAARAADGRESPLKLAPADHAFLVDFDAKATRLICGEVVYGITQRGDAPAFLLTYHPKTILGDPFAAGATVGDAAPVEIIPAGRPGAVRFRVVARGKPVAGATITVIRPDGSEDRATTDERGETGAYEPKGRYAAWARFVEPTPGEHRGKAYKEIRRYPTVVFDTGASAPSPAPAAPRVRADVTPASFTLTPNVTRHPVALPQAASSFGAAVSDGWLYVYGGHVVRTHSYSTDSVSGQFHRLKLDSASPAWEALPAGPALQGMNLVAHGGSIYRVGGMRPLNPPGAKADTRSVPDCARFDPAAKQWKPLASLPEPRSSHDVVAVGDKLIVVGGWTLRGREGHTAWPDSALVLDLSSANPTWQSIPQPFRRRALIAAVVDGKVYAIGGFDEDDDPSLAVDVYDPATNNWMSGPKLLGPARNGFGPAAAALDGRLYASVADGSLYRLNDRGDGWEKAAAATPRIVHRLVPWDGRILVIGGAAKGDNLNLIETVDVRAAAAARSE